MDSRTIHLQRVDAAGNSMPQISHYHHDNASSNIDASYFFRFTNFEGKMFFLKLAKSREWMTGDLAVEVVRLDGFSSLQAPRTQSSCHYSGQVHRAMDGDGLKEEKAVMGEMVADSWTALSGCDGQLVSVFECQRNVCVCCKWIGRYLFPNNCIVY